MRITLEKTAQESDQTIGLAIKNMKTHSLSKPLTFLYMSLKFYNIPPPKRAMSRGSWKSAS